MSHEGFVQLPGFRLSVELERDGLGSGDEVAILRTELTVSSAIQDARFITEGLAGCSAQVGSVAGLARVNATEPAGRRDDSAGLGAIVFVAPVAVIALLAGVGGTVPAVFRGNVATAVEVEGAVLEARKRSRAEAQGGTVLLVEVRTVALFREVDVSVTAGVALAVVVVPADGITEELSAGVSQIHGLADHAGGVLAVAELAVVGDAVTAHVTCGRIEHAVGAAGEGSGKETGGFTGFPVQVRSFAFLCAFDEAVAAGTALAVVNSAVGSASDFSVIVTGRGTRGGAKIGSVTSFAGVHGPVSARPTPGGEDRVAGNGAGELASIEAVVEASESVEIGSITGFAGFDKAI